MYVRAEEMGCPGPTPSHFDGILSTMQFCIVSSKSWHPLHWSVTDRCQDFAEIHIVKNETLPYKRAVHAIYIIKISRPTTINRFGQAGLEGAWSLPNSLSLVQKSIKSDLWNSEDLNHEIQAKSIRGVFQKFMCSFIMPS